MKFAALLFVLPALFLSACHTDTLATERKLYAPQRGTGVYSEALKTGSWKNGEYPAPAKKKVATPDAATDETTPGDVLPPS